MMDKWEIPNLPPLHVQDTMGASSNNIFSQSRAFKFDNYIPKFLALHYAARYDNLDLLQWLIENHANLKTKAK